MFDLKNFCYLFKCVNIYLYVFFYFKLGSAHHGVALHALEFQLRLFFLEIVYAFAKAR